MRATHPPTHLSQQWARALRLPEEVRGNLLTRLAPELKGLQWERDAANVTASV